MAVSPAVALYVNDPTKETRLESVCNCNVGHKITNLIILSLWSLLKRKNYTYIAN
jgi:hypothetical protein